jgi:CelD/BcsL family acetyltransferase involved in cellulose biosynthesis
VASALAIENPDELRPHVAAWDRLAVLRRQPYGAPDWMLAWWRHAAPRASRLAVVVVREGDEVIGVAPWHQHRLRTGLRMARLLGTGHRVEPLALPGREQEVAAAVAGALDGMSDGPGALALDRLDARSPWPVLLAREGPLGSRVAGRELTGAPVVPIEGLTYEEWLGAHSRNFREQRAQARRRLEREGAVIRLAEEPGDVDAAIAAFARITADRWEPPPWGEPRGDGVEGMLHEAARAMVPAGRMRVWVLEVEGRPVCVQVFVVADGEVGYWNGGFDPAWARLRPGFETIVRAIEDAIARGDRRVDLGGGASAYKRRLTDADEPLAAALVLPGGRDLPVRAAQLLPGRLDRLMVRTAKRLPPRIREPLRRLRR